MNNLAFWEALCGKPVNFMDSKNEERAGFLVSASYDVGDYHCGKHFRLLVAVPRPGVFPISVPTTHELIEVCAADCTIVF
jgi:hypothetical protein